MRKLNIDMWYGNSISEADGIKVKQLISNAKGRRL